MDVPTVDAPVESQGQPPLRRWRWRIVTIGAVVAIYVISILGYFWLDSSARELQPGNLDASAVTVVLLEVTAIHPTDHRVEVDVRLIPQTGFLDPELGKLTTDMSVRLCPCAELGELEFPKGKVPKVVRTSMVAEGAADMWPFDTFTIGSVGADVLVGPEGGSQRFVPARVEVAGSLYGWDIRSERTGPSAQAGFPGDSATITFTRARGPMALILGICLVLVTLPAIALYAAIEMLLGKKKFQPPFSTWFAAMLFSVVPLRTVLPGNPPAGSWIDEVLVIWVLMALVAAMVIYLVAWARRSD
ncbi:DUF4436 family protein [Mycobacterium sp. shizuoka-1]|uniref:DUF4436 family protein n=1 Tax=Mycobacterium sp. shizuoka-1 TaxID=2039281 RepID=UPI000C05F6D1|nr:DUF4436 family protein [Mycobacterium sp. shizuoka-1]GAY18779.1 DUF4436 domain-containing protein [Mycobacterium sp. shizuoka-1]